MCKQDSARSFLFLKSSFSGLVTMIFHFPSERLSAGKLQGIKGTRFLFHPPSSLWDNSFSSGMGFRLWFRASLEHDERQFLGNEPISYSLRRQRTSSSLWWNLGLLSSHPVFTGWNKENKNNRTLGDWGLPSSFPFFTQACVPVSIDQFPLNLPIPGIQCYATRIFQLSVHICIEVSTRN